MKLLWIIWSRPACNRFEEQCVHGRLVNLVFSDVEWTLGTSTALDALMGHCSGMRREAVGKGQLNGKYRVTQCLRCPSRLAPHAERSWRVAEQRGKKARGYGKREREEAQFGKVQWSRAWKGGPRSLRRERLEGLQWTTSCRPAAVRRVGLRGKRVMRVRRNRSSDPMRWPRVSRLKSQVLAYQLAGSSLFQAFLTLLSVRKFVVLFVK